MRWRRRRRLFSRSLRRPRRETDKTDETLASQTSSPATDRDNSTSITITPEEKEERRREESHGPVRVWTTAVVRRLELCATMLTRGMRE